MNITYFCKGCLQHGYHKIQDFNESGEDRNVAKLKCLHCETPAFVVEYPKGATAPTSASPRVKIIEDDVQKNDGC